MKRCAMAPMIEARHDGRLVGRDEGSIERHLATCAECRELTGELARLRVLARHDTAEAPSPLDHQRGRVRLLREAALSPAAPPSRRPRAALLAAAAMVAVIGSAAAAMELRSTSAGAPRAAASVAAGETMIRPSQGARYARRSSGGEETIELDTGTVDLAIGARAPSEGFVVRTTDGDVRASAARLRVTATFGHLRSLEVVEGTAEVRYAGELVVLHGGERFDAPEPPAEPRAADDDHDDARAQDAPAPAPTLVDTTPKPAYDRGEPKARAAHAPTTDASHDASASRPKRAPSAEHPAASSTSRHGAVDGGAPDGTAHDAFADGVGLVDRSDYAAAAEQLDAFQRAHPGDARAEDAAFLAIVALQRAGRERDAAQAARSYLARFPRGYRRAEAARIAAGSR